MYIGGTGVASHVQGYEFKPLHYKIKKHNITVHNFPKEWGSVSKQHYRITITIALNTESLKDIITFNI